MQQRCRRHLPHTLKGFVLLVALGFLGSAPGQVPTTRVVSGQVVTEEDAVISSGVTVAVETRDGQPWAQVHPDAQGRFEVTNLYRQTYSLVVKAEGFYPLQLYLDLKGGGVGPVVLRLVMHRAPKLKANSAMPALTDLSAPKNARQAFRKALQALQANRLDEAREKFGRAIAEYPCYARARTGLASIQIAARDLDGATANLREAMRCDPGFPDAFVLLGKVLNSETRFGESEEILKQGLRLSPEAWQLYDQLATAHYNQGQYDKAQEEWLRVLAIDPAPPAELHAKLAAAYLKAGVPDKAYAQMQAYLQADPKGRFASSFRAMMPRLKASGTQGAASPQPDQPAIPQP
jgi:tetratricopeptide (TPR) repeat protein